MAEDQLRWMKAFPFGKDLGDVLAILKVLIQCKGHCVKVAMRAVALTEADQAEGKYRDPETVAGVKKLAGPPAGVHSVAKGGHWYELDSPWLWVETLSISHLASDMQMAPGKAANDGVMDLLLSTGHSRLQLIGSLMKCESGTHINDPWFYRYKVAEVVFAPADPDYAFYMSGEVVGSDRAGKPMHVKCLPEKSLLWF